MSDWPSFLRIPDDRAVLGRADSWFAAVAERLLNGAELVVVRQAYRLVEIEFYLFGSHHPDPFTHRRPIQFQCGRWYFHRTGGSYRGGSFKGLDLTFGHGALSGGILIRSMARSDGTLIDGPSLCVDHLLNTLGVDRVAELDRIIGDRVAWDANNPLSLREKKLSRRHELLRTARVGLSLKKSSAASERTRYLMLPYRFLSEPRMVSKGKPHMVLALHAGGADVDTINRVTGCLKESIRRYIEDFEAGRRNGDFTAHFGVGAGPREWARLNGIWTKVFAACGLAVDC